MSVAPGLPALACPRCGRRPPPGSGPFCPFCGRYLATLRWVAEPPPSPAPVVQFRAQYSGPPRYRSIPRWGFPARAWLPPEPAGARPVDPLLAARSLVATAVPLLWATAAVALLAAGGEVWRYVLLLASREGTLSAGAVAASDALVTSAGRVAPVLGAVAGGVVVSWTVRAAEAAADRAGLRPARGARAMVLGWVVPGYNLAVPGAVLAEIEHTALGRPATLRPRPSRLLLVWWVLWAAGVVLAAVVLAWSLRGGVQAQADGVVLHAVLDVLAALTAVVTAVLLARLTRLLGPPRPRRRELVIRIRATARSARRDDDLPDRLLDARPTHRNQRSRRCGARSPRA